MSGVDVISDAIRDASSALASPVAHTREELTRHLDALELAPYRDTRSVAGAVLRAVEAAERLGDEELLDRASLVHADVLARQGGVQESAALALAINQRARESGSQHVAARSHNLLSSFFRRHGDLPGAMEHALLALDATPASARPEIRAHHLLTVALAYDEGGDTDGARRRYAEVIELAAAIGYPHLEITALNNLACLADDAGEADKARVLVEQMQAIAEQHGIVLGAMYVDTIAHVELSSGRPDMVERLLAPFLDASPAAGGVEPVEAADAPELLVTIAAAQTAAGELDRAQATLDRAVGLADSLELSMVRTRIHLTQSELYAARGDFERAYTEHRAFFTAHEALRSAEREARARVLQMVLGAEEARRNGEQFREMAIRDPLTGLYNRRFVNERLRRLLDRPHAGDGSVAVVILDVDHFKDVNDTYSHAVGDAVLVRLAGILVDAATGEDVPGAFAARLGGEEFLLALPGTGAQAAAAWCERLLATVRDADWATTGADLAITASIGLACGRPGDVSAPALMRRADEALYVAKRAGRDQVRLAAVPLSA